MESAGAVIRPRLRIDGRNVRVVQVDLVQALGNATHGLTVADAAAINRDRLDKKGRPLNPLLVAAGVETLFVAAVVIASVA